MLKKDLIIKVNYQFDVIERQRREITMLKDEIDFLKKFSRYNDDLTRALATTTEAVAHVLTDLKRR